jgi:hypothetical protein
MKYYLISIAATAASAEGAKIVHGKRQKTFSGPGRIICTEGECNFSVDRGLGCRDPCHTYTQSNMFEYSFVDVAAVTGRTILFPSKKLCYYKKATDIDTESWYDPWPLKIDEGCTATCTRCKFYPTVTISGPGLLNCVEGNCYNYTYGDPYNNCGRKMEDASEEWGEIAIALRGSNGAQVFQGYQNITSTQSIWIGRSCSLECSGCDFARRRKYVRRSDRGSA